MKENDFTPLIVKATNGFNFKGYHPKILNTLLNWLTINNQFSCVLKGGRCIAGYTSVVSSVFTCQRCKGETWCKWIDRFDLSSKCRHWRVYGRRGKPIDCVLIKRWWQLLERFGSQNCRRLGMTLSTPTKMKWRITNADNADSYGSHSFLQSVRKSEWFNARSDCWLTKSDSLGKTC